MRIAALHFIFLAGIVYSYHLGWLNSEPTQHILWVAIAFFTILILVIKEDV